MREEQGRVPQTAAIAYRLALRITGRQDRALASLEAAARRSEPTTTAFVNAVRDEARARRSGDPADPTTEPRPASLARVALDDWAVLERVALRGMTPAETAAALGIDRREVLVRLNRGLRAARDCLLGVGQDGDDADTRRLRRLCANLAVGRLGDASGDGQPEPAAASLLAS